ncbi:MAG: hypothetical protein AAFU73_01310 [Planctomycetota bacterium]
MEKRARLLIGTAGAAVGLAIGLWVFGFWAWGVGEMRGETSERGEAGRVDVAREPVVEVGRSADGPPTARREAATVAPTAPEDEALARALADERIGERPGVLVRLFDATGAPWDVASRAVESPLPPSWRAKPQLLALPAETVGGFPRVVPNRGGGRRRTERLSEGVIFVPATGDDEFLIAMIGSSPARGVFRGEPTHFRFTPDEPFHVHDVHAAPPEYPLGGLDADVRAGLSAQARSRRSVDRSAPLSPFRAGPNSRLLVERLPTRFPVLEAPWDGTAAPYAFDLPVGRYRLRSECRPEPRSGGPLRSLFFASSVGWGMKEFVVTAAGRSRVSMDLKTGAPLEITVEFAGADVGPDAFASLTLETEDGRRIPLDRRSVGRGRSPNRYSNSWGPGESDTVEGLPPGPARIVGSVWGTVRRFDVPIDVREGTSVQRVTIR